MRVYFLVMACLVGGCTRANGLYNPGAGGGGGNGGVPFGNGGGGGTGGGGNGGGGGSGGGGVGGGGAIDMAMSVGPDLATLPDLLSPVCGPDERRCIDPPESESCLGGQWNPDRLCPYGNPGKQAAQCSTGRCRPPVVNGLTGCNPQSGPGQNDGPQETLCSGSGGQGPAFSCQPFITDPSSQDAEWWCVVDAGGGTGSAGDKCSKNTDCRTGFCADNGTCFYACEGTLDCPLLKTGHLTMPCKDVVIHVEGVDLPVKSCTP